jgi:hypothetical protein
VTAVICLQIHRSSVLAERRYRGFAEVLIYTITEKGSHVRFERTGTHADLFR